MAEDIASLIIAAGCLVPGTQERRRPAWRNLGHRAHTMITAGLSHAHPARQIAAPYRQPPARPAVRKIQKALPSGAETHLAKAGGHTLANLCPYHYRSTGVNRWYNPRSGRVRRQGLEPRTRGLRVRCSAN